MHPDLAGLDGNVGEHTGDPVIDSFINMYLMLPECRASNTLGANIVVDTGGNGRNLDLQIVGAHGSAMIAVDRKEPRSAQSHPRYLWLYGSVYVPEYGEEGVSETDKHEAWANGISTIVGRAFRRTEQGLMMYVSSGTFCRDAVLAYSRVHTLNELRTEESKVQLAKRALHGSVVMAYTGRSVEPVFVEQAMEFTGRIQNVYQQVGSQYVPLLQYTDQQDTQRNAKP